MRGYQNKWQRDSIKSRQKECPEWHKCRLELSHEVNAEEHSTLLVLLHKRIGHLRSSKGGIAKVGEPGDQVE